MPDPTVFSIAVPQGVDAELRGHLLRADRQEDLCFGLWTPSEGATRRTALVHTVVLPHAGDRRVHGNASFEMQYVERVAELASAEGCGVVFMHSHLGPGWQGMSHDDVVAERDKLAGVVAGMTDLPLVGMTLGTDGAWSGRFWQRTGFKRYERAWCEVVRVVGETLTATFCDTILPRPTFRDTFRRTFSLSLCHVRHVGS